MRLANICKSLRVDDCGRVCSFPELLERVVRSGIACRTGLMIHASWCTAGGTITAKPSNAIIVADYSRPMKDPAAGGQQGRGANRKEGYLYFD